MVSCGFWPALDGTEVCELNPFAEFRSDFGRGRGRGRGGGGGFRQGKRSQGLVTAFPVSENLSIWLLCVFVCLCVFRGRRWRRIPGEWRYVGKKHQSLYQDEQAAGVCSSSLLNSTSLLTYSSYILVQVSWEEMRNSFPKVTAVNAPNRILGRGRMWGRILGGEG